MNEKPTQWQRRTSSVSSTARRLLVLMVLLSASSFFLLREGGSLQLLTAGNDNHTGSSTLLTAVQPPQPKPAAATYTPKIESADATAVSNTPDTRVSWPETRTIKMRVTAYCACPKCCGKNSDGITASGKSIHTNSSMFVAADTSLLPFGTMISIPGYHGGLPVPVLDRGRVIKNNRLDVFFLSHNQARKWGSRQLDVKVYLPEE